MTNFILDADGYPQPYDRLHPPPVGSDAYYAMPMNRRLWVRDRGAPGSLREASGGLRWLIQLFTGQA